MMHPEATTQADGDPDTAPAGEGRGRRQRRDALENQQRILATAKELFATQGAAATTMQEIARAAGVGQGTLYRHYPDKGAICHALIHEDLLAFQARVGALVAPGGSGDPLARLELLIDEKNRLTESHLPLMALMDELGLFSRRKRPFRGHFHLWLHERICGLLEEAVGRGEVAPLDIPFAADSILAAIAPPVYRSQREDGYTPERILAGMRQLFIGGLRRPA